jgi:protein-disulfide isomerase
MDTRWVLRHRPIEQIHPMAIPAAEAAECAAAQGRFWEYADAVFESQKALSYNKLFEVADQIGLNQRDFGLCVRLGTYNGLVRRATQEADRIQIRGTPTFFINGTRFDGVLPYDELKAHLR